MVSITFLRGGAKVQQQTYFTSPTDRIFPIANTACRSHVAHEIGVRSLHLELKGSLMPHLETLQRTKLMVGLLLLKKKQIPCLHAC
ncbi:hypothetical protein [Coleofasciculus sp. FACHB-1120]|uniref:hypothetical protein n=1 Tax=Coleofasciculus sp. FACHB-1120 TaxID=2692783 RepID=UPI001A7ED233|nr:hypothetical protein [Coleofasciculus sp. FACHB-1120]